MVGDLLDAMSGSRVPNYVTMVIQEVQTWLASAVSEDYAVDTAETAPGERNMSADLEYLLSQLEWANSYADVLPALKGTPGQEEALVLSLGPIILDEGLRMLVDHAALFARDVCRKVWMVSDTWVIGDVIPYIPHLKALRERGVQIHFMLVTPWNYVEIPWNGIAGDAK
jgi:hypothetical protein